LYAAPASPWTGLVDKSCIVIIIVHIRPQNSLLMWLTSLWLTLGCSNGYKQYAATLWC